MSDQSITTLPLRTEGIDLDAESVRAELDEAAHLHDIDPTSAALISQFEDEQIHEAIHDAFWEQYDAVRHRAIAQLAVQLGLGQHGAA